MAIGYLSGACVFNYPSLQHEIEHPRQFTLLSTRFLQACYNDLKDTNFDCPYPSVLRPPWITPDSDQIGPRPKSRTATILSPHSPRDHRPMREAPNQSQVERRLTDSVCGDPESRMNRAMNRKTLASILMWKYLMLDKSASWTPRTILPPRPSSRHVAGAGSVSSSARDRNRLVPIASDYVSPIGAVMA